jgi:PTS hybrid protein
VPPATVGIVLVSHSAVLARGAAELASEMGGGAVAIACAGGTEDGGLGTSLELLERAVQQVTGDAGAVIIPDLGSSVLTARSFLQDYKGEPPLAMIDAPFVEGAVAAVVAAGAGLPVDAVVAAAEDTRGLTKW